MPPSHQPRRRSPMVSCIERRERNEGRHLREDKATRRLCRALCFVGLMAQFALVGCCVGQSECGTHHVGKNKAGSFRTEPWPAAWRVGTSSPPPLSSSLSLSNIPANMSAVRRGDRRAARNQHSSPYNRPNAQSKKSVGVPSHVLHKYFPCPPSRGRLNETSAPVVVAVGILQFFESPAEQQVVGGTGGVLFGRGRWLRRETGI